MTNSEATCSLCTAICSAFTPDLRVVELMLNNEDMFPDDESNPKDPAIFRIAVALVHGFVESSRSEGGVSVAVRSEDAIKQSLLYWCNYYGLDAEEELGDFQRVIEDGSNLW